MQRWSVTCQHCHDTAFVVLGDLPGLSDVVMASKCEHLDGRPLKADTPLRCDSCGADIVTSGVEPSDRWKLLPEPNTNDPPFGTSADPTDIAAVRWAISVTAWPKRATASRRRVLRKATPDAP